MGSLPIPDNGFGGPHRPGHGCTRSGICPRVLYVHNRITFIGDRYRAELDTGKRESAGEIRKDSVNRSRSTLKGRIAEQMAPVPPDFCFNPADARFIGSSVDYIMFDGLTRVADENGDEIQIVFMDVKKGNGRLTRINRLIRQAVENKSVAWRTMRIAYD